MGNTGIATKNSLAEIQTALAELADNLSFHVGRTLSKAHGINIVQFASPIYDASGNDVQYYRNSQNVIVGRYQLRFTVNDTVYYAPASTTALSGSSGTGSITEADVSLLLNSTGRTGLITTFSLDLLQSIQAVQSNILLPHTKLGHWESHAPITVHRKTTYDASGATVGRYVAVIQVNGVKYEIPCDTQLGGPPRAMRWTGLGLATNNSFTHNAFQSSMDVPEIGYIFYRDGSGSTPRSILFQFTFGATRYQPIPEGATWVDVDPSGDTLVVTPFISFTTDAYNTNPTYPTAKLTLKMTITQPDGTPQAVGVCRAKVTNDAGVSYTNPVWTWAEDEDGCGFLGGAEVNTTTWYE